MRAIINRQQEFGTLDGVITKNDKIRTIVYQYLKNGSAKLLIDTEYVLMYELFELFPGTLNELNNI